MRTTQSFYSLNRGIVSRLGLARFDVKRLALAAQVQTNWIPKVLGPMTMRPGLGYTGATAGNAAARQLKFVFSTTDTARIELTDSSARVWIEDALLTRPAVTAVITNGTFTTDLSSWTDDDEGSAVSQWVSPGYMSLAGTSVDRARRTQQVTVNQAGTEHALRVVVARGPVTIRVGSSSGDDSYVTEAMLQTGNHSLSFTPTGNFYVQFLTYQQAPVLLDSVAVESAGVVSIPTPWAESDLDNIRYDQSGDIVFIACAGMQQRRIVRRGTRPQARSWSIDLYPQTDGPFNIQNVTDITLTPSATTGNITVTASKPVFRSTDVGGLYSLSSVGQQTSLTTSTPGQATASIRVTGVDNDRAFTVIVSGNATGSVINLQRSFDNATWANTGTTYVVDTTTSENDALDNQIIYYRLFLTSVGGADVITMQVQIGSGSIRGVVRVTAFTTSLAVTADVITTLGSVTASTVWQMGKWSDRSGWPTAVRIHEGRMWWSGMNGIWGSISDAYDSFDETFPGDAGTINRTVGSGPVDTVNWLLSLKGLLLGGQGSEYCARASSLDEPLTPTNFNLKVCSSQGSGAVDSVRIDQSGYYVNRTGAKVYEVSFDVRSYDYQSSNLMELAPEIALAGIVRMDVQRQPDTRLHCVLNDGTAVVIVTNKLEEVQALVTVETDGTIEDVVTLPALDGDLDDQVYYIVNRTINGSTVRYIEKWAQESDCRGDAQCLLADSYVTYSGVPIASIAAAHLEGQDVVVWADGIDIGTDDSALPWTQTYSVSGGVVTLPGTHANIVVGLPYTAQFQSSKLGLQIQGSSPLGEQKRIDHLGVVLANTHRKGIRHGARFDDYGTSTPYTMDDMPGIENGTAVTAEVSADYDQSYFEFPGEWVSDTRVCIQGQAPRPATVLSVVARLEQN